MLSNKQIIEFQALYKKRFNRKISHKQAMESGIKLIRLLELVYKPITKKEHEQIQKRRKTTKNL